MFQPAVSVLKACDSRKPLLPTPPLHHLWPQWQRQETTLRPYPHCLSGCQEGRRLRAHHYIPEALVTVIVHLPWVAGPCGRPRQQSVPPTGEWKASCSRLLSLFPSLVLRAQLSSPGRAPRWAWGCKPGWWCWAIPARAGLRRRQKAGAREGGFGERVDDPRVFCHEVVF